MAFLRRDFMVEWLGRGAGDTMSNENYRKSIPLFLVLLMILTPFASAAVTTFGNGDASVDIELRDGAEFENLNDGTINLPNGETVTSADLTISTNMLSHAAHSRIDTDTVYNVWDPAYNNMLTQFSNQADFMISDSNGATPVSLRAEGFLTDFEGTDGGFTDATEPLPSPAGVGWSHGTLYPSNVPSGCKSGLECWGTNIGDDDYTDDNDDLLPSSTAFDAKLNSAALWVDASLKSKTAYFSSWHNLHTIVGSQTNTFRYQDCAYLQIRSSPNPEFLPGDTGFEFLPIDISNSTGIGYGSGYAQRYSSVRDNNVHPNCQGLDDVASSNDYYGLAGTSVSTTNPSGWATIAINLEAYIGNYVQIRFVMEHNDIMGGTTVDQNNMSGWIIDNFRIGEVLPQNGSMIVRGITPSSTGGANQPNGYGLLTMEAVRTSSAVLSVDVLDLNNQIITNRDGDLMQGLQGDIIELWDIDANVNRAVNLRFNFNSGPDRLSTPVLHGFSVGTRVGTGFNMSHANLVNVNNGIWNSPGGGMPIIYNPLIEQSAFQGMLERGKFGYPITSVTPLIQKDCSENPTISINPIGTQSMVNLTNGVKTVLDDPIFGFSSMLSFQSPCNVGGMWFDLEFGHHAEGLEIDIADDGDVDYGYLEPALGAFGRQTQFILNTVGGVNYGTDSATITMNVAGEGEGAFFLLPQGATVTAADLAFDQVSVHSNTDPIE